MLRSAVLNACRKLLSQKQISLFFTNYIVITPNVVYYKEIPLRLVVAVEDEGL